MKTMIEITLEYMLEKCAGDKKKDVYLTFDNIFNHVEKELTEKWKIEAATKEKEYLKIRTNKMGELYRILTLDSRFRRSPEGLWTTREGVE